MIWLPSTGFRVNHALIFTIWRTVLCWRESVVKSDSRRLQWCGRGRLCKRRLYGRAPRPWRCCSPWLWWVRAVSLLTAANLDTDDWHLPTHTCCLVCFCLYDQLSHIYMSYNSTGYDQRLKSGKSYLKYVSNVDVSKLKIFKINSN